MPVYRRETYVRDLVQNAEFFQHEAAEGRRAYFVILFSLYRGIIFLVVDQALYLHLGKRPFFKGARYSPLYLFPVKRLPPSVPFNYHKLLVFNALITGKTVAAAVTFPAPPDSFAVCQSPRFNYLVVYASAIGTAHDNLNYVDRRYKIVQNSPNFRIGTKSNTHPINGLTLGYL
jgi:hypothetical protein